MKFPGIKKVGFGRLFCIPDRVKLCLQLWNLLIELRDAFLVRGNLFLELFRRNGGQLTNEIVGNAQSGFEIVDLILGLMA